MMKRGSAGLVLGLLAMATVMADAQRRVPGQQADTTVPVTIALKGDGKVYNFSGPAKCTHAPVAAIYGLRAERWTVDRSGEGALPATLALWRPATGPDLVSLSSTIGETRYSLNTIDQVQRIHCGGCGGRPVALPSSVTPTVAVRRTTSK